MQVIIKGKMPDDPRSRILAIEAVTKSICEEAGTDPAEGILMLLTAAVHLTQKYAQPSVQIEITLAEALGEAMVVADGFFKLRKVTK